VFYEAIGTLIENSADALTERHGDGRAKDVRDEREFRQITLLLRRVAAIWPDLFRSLEEELAVLDETLATAVAACPDLRVRLPATRAPRSSDPLTHYREVLADLDTVVIALHERRDDPAATSAARTVRRGLAAAAEVQGHLVDRALGVHGASPRSVQPGQRPTA
jgi:hypothetical protein